MKPPGGASHFHPLNVIGKNLSSELLLTLCLPSLVLLESRGLDSPNPWLESLLEAIPLEIIQHKLNDSSLAVTQRYLGITADEIAEACNKLDL